MRVAPYSTHSGGASGLVRDRGCLYYCPWIVIVLLCLEGAAIGVWSYYADQMRNNTQDGLNYLSVSSSWNDNLKPSAIATAVVFIVLLCCVAAIGFTHSFVEAALDATGTAGAGSLAELVLNAILGTLWYLVTIWLIFVVAACSIWAAMVYLMRGSINSQLQAYAEYPPVAWVPSDNEPCPGQCYDLTYFTFVSENFANSCTCDQVTLQNAYNAFDAAYSKDLAAVVTSAFFLLVAASLLGMNLACQFSHTKRQREMIRRATQKFYAGYL